MPVRCPIAVLPLAVLLFTPLPVQADPPVPPKKPAPQKPRIVLDALLQTALAAAPDADKWPNSDYARLLDIGDVTIQSDGTVVATYRETYKLFNERARTKAEVTLPYNASYEEIRVLKARTIRPDGTVVEVKPEDIRVTSPYQEFLMYDDAVGMSFSMPAIEDGCIIDYTFQKIQRPLLMPGQHWTYWGFNGLEPVGLCRYTLKAPADKPLRYKVYNDEAFAPKVAASPDGKTKTYVWERRDMTPLELEPAMPPLHEIRVYMETTSLNSWQDVAAWYWKLAKPQMQANDTLKATVAKLTAGKTNDDAKARALYDYVANKVRYVGIEFGLSAVKPHAATEVQAKLYGDCKDKATLLITMLAEAGIKAHPVLLKAGAPETIENKLPGLSAFNHCITLANVGGKDVWLDATSETCAYGDIPAGDRGVQALVVKEGQSELRTIPVYTPEENGMAVVQRVVLKADGSATVQAEIQMHGNYGQQMRTAVRALNPDRRKQMMQSMATAYSNGSKLKEWTLPDGTAKDGPFVMRLTVESPSFAALTGSLLLVPLVTNETSGNGSSLVKESRVWPVVENTASRMRSETVFTLPDGWNVLDLPAEMTLACAIQGYTRTVTKSPDGKTITVVETGEEKPGRVLPADYGKLKAYETEHAKAQKAKLVLKEAGK